MRSGTILPNLGSLCLMFFDDQTLLKNKTFEQHHQCIPNKINLIKDLESQYSPHLLVGVCAKYTHTSLCVLACVACQSVSEREGASYRSLRFPSLMPHYTEQFFPLITPVTHWGNSQTDCRHEGEHDTESFFHFSPLFPCFVSLTF